MICTICGQDKTPYNFVVNPNNPLVCFDCGGPYTCIECGETCPPSHFRIQGKICKTCKDKNPRRFARSRPKEERNSAALGVRAATTQNDAANTRESDLS